MGQHRVLPQGKWLAFQDKAGQPRNSMIVTGILIFLTMLVRDLNAIAPLVTMFFLITYAMLNVVVIIEQKLGLISFRPQFKVHWIIPWLGLVGSLMAMFIINPVVSLISWALVAVVYGVLSRSDLETPFEDVRSGLFSSFAEWAAKLTASQNTKQERSWKPNLLIPTTDVATIHGSYTMIKDIAYPKGSAALMGISNENNGALIKKSIISITEAFKKDDLHSSWSIMVTNKFAEGVNFGNQALNHAFFKPNIVFLSMLEKEEVLQDYPKIIYEAKRLELGVLLYLLHPISQLGQKQNVNIWVRNPGIQWETVNSIGNIDLAMLTAYKLMQNWNATINLITVVDDVAKKENAQLFLNELIELSRLSEFKSKVVVGDFRTELVNSGHVDLNIFGLSDQINLDYNIQLMELSKTSCLFVQDSGNENVLA